MSNYINTTGFRYNVTTLSELCEKITVGLAIAVTPYVRDHGIKLIRNQNIRPNKFDNRDIVYVDEGFARRQNGKKVFNGDVITVRTGANIGETCVVPSDFDGALTFTTLISRPRIDVLYPDYLAQYINSSFGQTEVKRLMAGGGKGNLNAGELKKMLLPIPPYPIQKKVSEMLKNWDCAIEKVERLIAAKEKRFHWMLSKYLSGRVLKKPFSQKWKNISFGEIFEQHKIVNKHNDNLEVLSVTKNGVVRQSDYFNKEIASEDKSKYLIVERGTLVMSGLNFWMGSLDFQSICDIGIVSPAYKV